MEPPNDDALTNDDDWTDVPNVILLDRYATREDRLVGALLCAYAAPTGRLRVDGRVLVLPDGPRTRVPSYLIVDPKVSPDARMLGLLLFLRAGRRQPLLDNQAELAYLLGCTRADLRRWLRELRDVGWVVYLARTA